MLTDRTENSEEDRALADRFDPEQCTDRMCSGDETDEEKAMHVFGQSVLPLTDKYVYSSDESLFDGGHMSTLIQSEQLAQFVHEIAGKRKNS